MNYFKRRVLKIVSLQWSTDNDESRREIFVLGNLRLRVPIALRRESCEDVEGPAGLKISSLLKQIVRKQHVF